MSTARHLKVLDSPTEAAFLDTALKVAFTSSNMQSVDQHFGAAEAVVVYAVNPEQARLLEVTEFNHPKYEDGEDKVAPKLAALDGCIAVYTNAVGASATKQLRMMGIQPVKVVPGAVIEDLVEALQDELRAGPSVWLARAIDLLHPRYADRFETMDAEGWDE